MRNSMYTSISERPASSPRPDPKLAPQSSKANIKTYLQLNFGLCDILLASTATCNFLRLRELITDSLLVMSVCLLTFKDRVDSYLGAEIFQWESLHLAHSQ